MAGCGMALVLSLYPGPAPAARARAATGAGTGAGAAGHPAMGAPVDPAPLAGRCSDAAGTALQTRWRGPVHWRVNLATVPAYLVDPDQVSQTARSAAIAVAQARNDCQLPEREVISQRFEGVTRRRANITTNGDCARRDGRNTLSFGRLTPGLLAVTCVWWEGADGRGRGVEADILVDQAEGLYFLSMPERCRSRWDLASILTHEFGHVFGLGHVPYSRHASQTMSDSLPECCAGFRTLGLGDYLTLLEHHGRRDASA